MQLSLAKAFNKKGATMIELIGMMAIMGLGIGSMLGVIGSGTNFAKDTEDTIKAINLAREGIEGVTNLRNTNWLRFSSDKTNCWKVRNYVSSCIGGGGGVSDFSTGSYILYTRNGAWYLTDVAPIDYVTNWTAYRNAYKTWLDGNGYYTQTGLVVPTNLCSSIGQPNCLTPFNREIQLSISGTGTMYVTSLVRWQGRRLREVTLTTTLTNWKSKF